MRRALLIIIAICLITIGIPRDTQALSWSSLFGQSASLSASNPSTQPCLSYQQRHYEVCTAYMFNSSLAARLPYYAYAKSQNPSWTRLADYRLNSRYTGQAYQKIRQQAQSWPAGIAITTIPAITISSVAVTSDLNFATLHTTESWEVRSQSGATLFSEHNRTHIITMQRVPGLILHKWVVIGIY